MAERKEKDVAHGGPRTRGGFGQLAEPKDTDMFSLFSHVFTEDNGSSSAVDPEGASVLGRFSEKNVNIHNLESFLDSKMEECAAECKAFTLAQSEDPAVTGRIGPAEVLLDSSSNIGTLIVQLDKLGAASHSNFSTMRANTCVFKGKWVYEIMLGSKGVMQLGWCTLNCRFSQEEGVGDTADSYAYDGSRLRKWNVRTFKYGEAWLTGDVISCAIDLDNGHLEFFRNGHSMGIAFTNVKTGPGYAYFPAFSLSMEENVQVNFGATPLKFPVEDYQPLQDPKVLDACQARVLLHYTEKLVTILVEEDKMAGIDILTSKMELNSPPLTDHRSKVCSTMLVCSHVMGKLGPLLKLPYVVESSLLPSLVKMSGEGMWRQPQPRLIKFLDLLWELLELEYEVRPCMEHLANVLMSLYRYSPVLEDFSNAKRYLSLTVCVFRHHKSRRFILENLLFEKVKFPIFMHIKPPDDLGLAKLIPTVWWKYATKSETDEIPPLTAEEEVRKSMYTAACEKLRRTIEEVEEIQVEMLKLLLLHTDAEEGRTSRDIFMPKLHFLLKELCGITWAFHSVSCPLPVLLCFFHRLLRAVRHYWDAFQAEDSDRFVFSEEAFVPIHLFWSDSRALIDFQRCGGLLSHLNRTLGTEVNKAQDLEVRDDGKVVSRADRKCVKESGDEYPPREMPSGNSLMEFLDGLVVLYHSAAHKQLSKMWILHDNMRDFVLALQDTQQKISKCPPDLTSVREDLEKAKQVFQTKVTELSRHMAWVYAVIYSQTKQRDVEWLLRVVLRTLEKASGFRQLFQYVPELYVETCIFTFNALRNFFNVAQPFSSLPSVNQLSQQYATFLVDHFADSRIVSNDLRDNIVQALALFTCHTDTLTVLEKLAMNKRLAMVEALLAPYENRSWAHTNWILVRLWKGCGFANRYKHLPNLLPAKVQPTDFTFVSVQEPCPSQVFQSLLAKTLLDNEALSTRFLDTLMNQLNWSFSEFVGMMQEIQQLTSRSENVLLEGRQVKICAACFEISICLLRVLEMVATVAPQLFTDWSRPSAELFLKRIMQLLSQIVMRVTIADGAFETLVTSPVPGMDGVTYFPVLSVTVGILAQLIVRCGGSSQEKAVRALLTDTGFQPSALEFMLGRSPNPEKKKDKPLFSFRTFEEVSSEELQDIESLISHLQHQQVILGSIIQETCEDDLCTICYANAQSAVFVPCHHKSCKTCITQQLLSKRECFFCKATITAVQDLKGRPLLREHFVTGSPRK